MRRLWCLALVLAALVQGPAWGQETQGTELERVLRAWSDSLKAWQALPDSLRREKAKQFLAGISLERIRKICQEEMPAELERTLKGFMKARLEAAPLSALDLAALLSDVEVKAPCHQGIVLFLSHNRERYDTPENAEVLARAMLDLADESGYPEGIRHQLEMGAAYFSSSDLLYRRMLAYRDSGDARQQVWAVDLMWESRDPRARKLLRETLEIYWRRGPSKALYRAMTKAAERLGPEVFPTLAAIFREAPDPDTWRAALEALGRCRAPRAMGIILAAYGDSATGIRDRTDEIVDRAEYSRYYHLWLATRLLEPTLVEALEGEDAELARQALELLDRESRFGAAANPDAVIGALQSFANKAPRDLSWRAVETAGRFERRRQEVEARRQELPFPR
jgi:hypothetical protein